MTRFLALLLLLCAAGCATTREVMGHGSETGVSAVSLHAAPGGAHPLNAQADSAWLHFHAPRFGSYGCEPDTTLLRDWQRVEVWKLNETTPPGYYHGCEADTACWRRVVQWNEPRVVWAAWKAPGDSCAVRVGPGQYVPWVRGQRCSEWRIARVGE